MPPAPHQRPRALRTLASALPIVLAATLAALTATAEPARAIPRHYLLETAGSSVGYEADFGKDKIVGTIPVSMANLTLDFASLANCRVQVVLDAAAATANFPFAAQALRGPLVLDTARHPDIRFVSTAVHPKGDGALIDGNITIRGVTRPITLDAALYRQRGTAKGSLDRLQIRLKGTIQRDAFNADGWSSMVGNDVRIDIIADIREQG
ncbi:MAG: YceI family protein [Paracoccaceae bacterium]|nr:YceI family protein [Paracoccaceae bacterium]MDE3240789.1 YceI family protein [Paracoccaceae bacterium]